MAKRRTLDPTAPFQSISAAARLTGLAQCYIRDGCKKKTIPHIRCGQEFRINMPLWLEQLNAESARGGEA